MRWIYFVLLALAVLLVQTTIVRIIWIPTAVGDIAPVLPAAMAVFIAMFARSGIDAALAGWALGLALDMSLAGGEGMGLLALLFAAGAGAVYRIREALFCERTLTQALMGLAFCLFVLEAWVGYQVVFGDVPRADFAARALQALGVSVYTAVVTPPVCAALKRLRRVLFVVAPTRERR